ncbi:MAG: hypothetical protein ACKVUS_13455 [Saprospiraceae bacterium]
MPEYFVFLTKTAAKQLHKPRRLAAASLILGLVYLFCSGNCLPKVKYSASGFLFGQPFQTTVDSPAAKTFLENPADSSLQSILRETEAQPLENATLAALSAKTSTDFATFYLLDRWYRQPENHAAQDDFRGFIQKIAPSQTLPAECDDLKNYLVVFVPGLAYREDRTTGADFARQIQLLTAAGIPNLLIETDEWGLSEANALIIAQKLRELNAAHERILLVSASKGGLEVAIALGKILRPDEVPHLKAWVSVGGILRGSPVADQYLCFPKCWLAEVQLFFKGKDISTVRDISHKRRSVEFAELRFSEHLLKIQFVGAPLATQISREIRGRWCSMRHIAPNDGLTTLPDQIIPGSLIVSEPGLDHYFRDPAIDVKTLALACVAEKRLRANK